MAAARKRATSDEVGLDVSVRDGLMAVVFDANCFGYGRPDLEQLSLFARRLAEIDLPVWIPEPVAWEWAEHLAQDWSSAQTATNATNRTLAKSGLAPFQTVFADTNHVITAFLDELAALSNVQVIPLSPEHALAGLRDQVLQLPPAKRKGADGERVKTGASDSAWMREVISRAGDDPARLLFISEDRDVETALTAWKHATALVRPRKNLFATLFTVRIDSGDAAAIMLRHLVSQLPADQGAGILDLGAVTDLASSVEHLLSPDIDWIDTVALTRVTGVSGIFAVLAEESTDSSVHRTSGLASESGNPAGRARRLYDQVDRETPHIAVATVMLLAEARATTVANLHHGQRITDTHTVHDVLLRTDVFVDLAAGKVVGLQPDSTIALRPCDAFDDDDHALQSFAENLCDVIPGLEFPDGWPFQDETEFDRDVNGHHVRLSYESGDVGEWVVQATIDDAASATLSCSYDVGARVWDGPESFDMPGAYPIRVDIANSANPLWAFSWWIIRRIYGRSDNGGR